MLDRVVMLAASAIALNFKLPVSGVAFKAAVVHGGRLELHIPSDGLIEFVTFLPLTSLNAEASPSSLAWPPTPGELVQ